MSSAFFADTEAPIVSVTAKKHFEALPSKNSQLYAHYLSRASHHGTRAVLRSVSPESEDIYDLILTIHRALNKPSSNEEYQERLAASTSATAVQQYLEYASQFLANLGNYKGFGDKKFIPRLSVEEFDQLVKQVGDDKATQLYNSVREPLYSLDATLLGWPENGQISNYYPNSPDITKADVEAVNKAIADKGIMPENTRVEKVSAKEFIVHVASAETGNHTGYYPDSLNEDGISITFKFGDHSKEFKKIVESFEEAAKYTANETQEKLIAKYIESFKTGSMNAHKQSQEFWVKDINPDVESNVGFIETYRDPSGVRGEWEGLVAMVNQERTAKFSALVKNASPLIAFLPWDKVYEKDVFTPPDFTSLEVLTFAGSGIPAGINIPNYDDVRLNIGFKNVSLGNIISAEPKKQKNQEPTSFLTPEVDEKWRKWRVDAFEVVVGLHELLGHGTGKLLQETSPGVYNFDKETSQVNSWYAPNSTWGSLFGSVAGAYEECRAELVALYLVLSKPNEVLPIFGYNDKSEYGDIKLVSTLSMVRAGLVGLEFWDPNSKKWGQAHMQARFSIFKVLYEAGVVSLDYSDKEKYSDLILHVDESKLDNVAVDALGKYLHDLHVLKSTGNVKEGTALFNDKSGVTEDFAKFRDVVLSKKLPRKQTIQGNTVIRDGKVEVDEYPESETGMIESFSQRNV